MPLIVDKIFLRSYVCRLSVTRTLKFWRKNEESNIPAVEAPELEWTESTSSLPAEDICRMKDKSRLSDDIKMRYLKKELPPFEEDYYYQIDKLREFYGEFGKQSGLNPGLCWPTTEELKLQREYEALAYRPLQELIRNVNLKNEKVDSHRKRKEKEVADNMMKLQKIIQENQAQLAKKEAAAEAQRLRKEKLVDEIREELGYHIDPNDPRYTEIMMRREEQQKKAAKEAKKKKVKEDRIEQIKQLAGETVTSDKAKSDDDEDSSDDESFVKK